MAGMSILVTGWLPLKSIPIFFTSIHENAADRLLEIVLPELTHANLLHIMQFVRDVGIWQLGALFSRFDHCYTAVKPFPQTYLPDNDQSG